MKENLITIEKDQPFIYNGKRVKINQYGDLSFAYPDDWVRLKKLKLIKGDIIEYYSETYDQVLTGKYVGYRPKGNIEVKPFQEDKQSEYIRVSAKVKPKKED